MPVDAQTLILNAFIHARNHLRSWLEDEIERAHHRSDSAGWKQRREAERADCERMQEAVRRDIKPDRVPASFRDITPWAARLGVGDDVCRRELVAGLTAAERSQLLRAVQSRASTIHAWLDEFGAGTMPPEATAILYLLLGIEEMERGA